MTSLKVKFRPSSKAGQEGTIYYQIISQRRVKQFATNYHVFPEEWDERRSTVYAGGANGRRELIMYIRENMKWDIDRLNRIIRNLDAGGDNYTPDDVTEEFHRYTNEYLLSNFMKNIIIKLRQNGKIRTAEAYTAALNNFKLFLNETTNKYDLLYQEDIMLDRITHEIMESYEAWQKRRGIVPNTISFYTRILRAVYNRAVDNEIIENRRPFRHVYTGIGKTVKRALPIKIISKIKCLDLTEMPRVDYARDMFMLSFYLRGMSFVDMAYLRKSDLKLGYVTYRRRKTGQSLRIKWTKEMQRIIDKYPPNPTTYLFPIIKNPGTSERNAYRNACYNINRNLKKIGELTGIDIPLTLYCARHSWASAAKTKGIPVSVISEGMGHDNESTTRIYLASLDTSVIDRANTIIISSI